MNQLHVGFRNKIDLPNARFLLIDDEVRDIPRSRVFDPMKHCFIPLKGIEYKRARELAELFYTISPQGDNTLTVRNGKRALLKSLMKAERLDSIRGDEEVNGMIGDILVSPVLRRVLCNPTNFSFNERSVIQARINRKELGEFDATVLALLLMSHYKGQVCVPDFGFYGREIHTRLIREEQLIAGVSFLGELPPKLRKTVLLIEEKIVSGTATTDDAELLAMYAKLEERTNAYNDFVKGAIA